MDINDFNSKLWDWLINRSPKNAARPDVQSRPPDDVLNSAQPYWGQRIETNIDTQSILGLLLRMASIDNVSRTSDGELVNRHEDETVVLLGCGHLGTLHRRKDKKDDEIKNIAGQCRHCATALQEELLSLSSTAINLRALLDKELKTLVCEDCGKITTSGHLACPDHYTKVAGPDGTGQYLGPEEAQEQERQDITKMILGPIFSLLSKERQETPEQNSQDKKQ